MDRMERVHAAVTGGLRGRPRDVTELNHALFLRLAAEVQGYCRDLHDESIAAMLTPTLVPNAALRETFRHVLEDNRKLGSGNAGPGNIGNDWIRLGMQLWAELYSAYPSPTVGGRDWNKRLEWLNSARNGIAHNDTVKVAAAHDDHPLTLNTFRVMRGRLTKFATALDAVTGAYLKTTTGTAPW
ncbi:hypothetical protein ACFC14_18670 [Microbacterium sp. NPDC055988]|uniref:hypothetical protein n=1 Tax=Microbacterium sp. NPDC055988 TaxID=3345671 RepID=UPI0035E37170